MKLEVGTPTEYFLDDFLISNLNDLKKAVDKHWDGVVLVDGIEGTAKTTLAATCCRYLDPNYCLDNVCFTQDQFFEMVDKAKPYTAIHWDEFIFGGLSTEALGKQQNALMKKMGTIRKKRLYIFLVMPWFFMMRAAFAIGRSRALIHCYTPDGISRGTFMFYSFPKKQKLYNIMRTNKIYSYSPVKADFIGRFTDTFGLFWNEKEYDKKKENAIERISKDSDKGSKKEDKYLKILYRITVILKNEEKYSWQRLNQIYGVTPTTIRAWYANAIDIIKDNEKGYSKIKEQDNNINVSDKPEDNQDKQGDDI